MKVGEIVQDSIIKNKEKTKNYWEKLMLAASSQSSVSENVKQSNIKRSQSSHAIKNDCLIEEEQNGGPKIVETITKKDLDEKSEDNVKNVFNRVIKSNTGSVVEKEIRWQREREVEFALEREEALRKANKNTTVSSDQEESLNFSIPTTDDGNFSEYGSEDKEDQSHDDESRVIRSGLHCRTQSTDSLSSGHSSGGSIGSGETSRRPVFTNKIHHRPEEECQYGRSMKETPIEREIRLTKEREDELRREKQFLQSSITSKTRSNSLTCERHATVKNSSVIDNKSSQPLKQGSQKVSGYHKLYTLSHSKSLSNISDKQSSVGPSSKFSTTNNLLGCSNVSKSISNENPSAKGAVPKLFSRNPNQQKGLMKRFIASRGKLNSTFTFSSPTFSNSSNSSGLVQLSPTKVQHWNSFVGKEKKDTAMIGTRPGYVSAEDKIQFELQEMRRREQELKEQRAKSFHRSQPDLLALQDDEEETVSSYQIQPVKLRSAVSNPNLLNVDDEKTKYEMKPSIKRIALIDVWENMIQKK